MFTAILSAMFVASIIATRPMFKVIEHSSEKKKEKDAKKEAMINYLEKDIVDIEH